MKEAFRKISCKLMNRHRGEPFLHDRDGRWVKKCQDCGEYYKIIRDERSGEISIEYWSHLKAL
jgi:hypothetical protein